MTFKLLMSIKDKVTGFVTNPVHYLSGWLVWDGIRRALEGYYQIAAVEALLAVTVEVKDALNRKNARICEQFEAEAEKDIAWINTIYPELRELERKTQAFCQQTASMVQATSSMVKSYPPQPLPLEDIIGPRMDYMKSPLPKTDCIYKYGDFG